MHLFERRINRATYYVGHFIPFLYMLLVIWLLSLLNLSFDANQATLFLVLLSPIVPYEVSLQVRRNHDLGYKGLYPPIGRNLGMSDWALTSKPGQKKKNRFGLPPRPGIDWRALLLLR